MNPIEKQTGQAQPTTTLGQRWMLDQVLPLKSSSTRRDAPAGRLYKKKLQLNPLLERTG
jgi:hypothetical protein